ncbi:MAG: energy transducer TonB [Sphingobium sp.]|nr:energy transducer TonB [Sphingobium sp.]
MKAVKVELDKCEDALMSKAGLDGPSLRTLQRPATPIGSPSDWIKSDDYPFTMMSMGKSAALLVWLGIDETGKVTDCRVINGIGDGPFRKRSCDKLVERAKFEPAISASGSPARSYTERKIFWTLEGEDFRR